MQLGNIQYKVDKQEYKKHVTIHSSAVINNNNNLLCEGGKTLQDSHLREYMTKHIFPYLDFYPGPIFIKVLPVKVLPG